MSEVWYNLGGAIVIMGGWLVLWRVFPRKVDREYAACGFCGYLTTGLPSSICPECGRDLNVVGVRRPARWREITPQTRVLLTVLSFTAAFAFASWRVWIPFHEHLQPGTYFFSDQVDLRESGNQHMVMINRAAFAYCWPWERSSVLPQITSPGAWLIEISPGFSCVPDPEDILEGRLAPNHIVPADDKYRPLNELPAAMRNRLGPATADRFWVDCRSDRYGWSDPDTRDHHFRNGGFEKDLNGWLRKWAERLHAPSFPQRVWTATRIALAASFRGGNDLKYPGCHLAGSGWGFDWEPNKHWTLAFWTSVVVLYCGLMLVLVRRSTWWRARTGFICRYSPELLLGTRSSSNHENAEV